MAEIDVYTRLRPDSSYKLVEVSPELLKIFEEGTNTLTIKAPTADSHLVLCSDSQTFRVRQNNHSNTLLLMEHDQNSSRLLGFASLGSNLELTKIKGRIDTIKLPIYYGMQSIKEFENLKEKEDIYTLMDRSPVSKKEFAKIWSEYNGCEINRVACLLSRDFMSASLHLLITTIIASNLDMKNLIAGEVLTLIDDEEYTKEIICTVLRKFSKSLEEPFELDDSKICIWYGIESLKKYANNLTDPEEFLIKWKSEFPPFFSCSIDLNQLYGFFVRPLPNRIQFLSKDSLPMDPSDRFKTLFRIQSTWDLVEFEPFIRDVNTRNLKVESFIMKYAKKKKIGKKTIVSSR